MADAKAIGYLELNIQGFQQALDTAKRALATFGVALSAYKGMQFLKNGVKDAIDFGNAAYFAAQQVGKADPGKFLIMQKALENVGYSAEQARATIKEFVETGKPLETIFGGSAKYGQALTNATAQYGTQAKILSENAARFSKVFETLQAVGGKIREFFLGMTAQFLKPLQALLETIQKIDLAGIGAKFGAKFADAVNLLNGALKTNTLGDIIAAGFKLGVAYYNASYDRLFDILLAGAEAMGVAINSVIVSIDWGNAGLLLARNLVKAMITPFELIARTFVLIFSKLGEVIGAAIDLLPGQKGNAEDARRKGAQHQAEFGEYFSAIKNFLPEPGSLLNANTSMIIPIIKDALKQASAAIGNLTETPEVKKAREALGILAENARKAGEEMAKNAPDKQQASTYLQPDAFKVIADSLARVGGGGGVIRVGQTVQEKQLMVQQRIQQEITRAANAIEKITPEGSPVMQTSSAGVNF